jgi:hypothetical protein
MPLPAQPYQYTQWRCVRIAPDYLTEVQGHTPCRPAIRQVVEVRATEGMSSCPSPQPHREPPALRREATPHNIPEYMPRAHRRRRSPAGRRREDWSTVASREAIMRAKPRPEQGFRFCRPACIGFPQQCLLRGCFGSRVNLRVRRPRGCSGLRVHEADCVAGTARHPELRCVPNGSWSIEPDAEAFARPRRLHEWVKYPAPAGTVA